MVWMRNGINTLNNHMKTLSKHVAETIWWASETKRLRSKFIWKKDGVLLFMLNDQMIIFVHLDCKLGLTDASTPLQSSQCQWKWKILETHSLHLTQHWKICASAFSILTFCIYQVGANFCLIQVPPIMRKKRYSHYSFGWWWWAKAIDSSC